MRVTKVLNLKGYPQERAPTKSANELVLEAYRTLMLSNMGGSFRIASALRCLPLSSPFESCSARTAFLQLFFKIIAD